MEKTTKKVSKRSPSKEEDYKPKRLNALGKWFFDPNTKPLIKIVDMRAVLK
jgi:hypothetical protein